MDNLANVQINIYMLLCALLCVRWFTKSRYVWVGLLLGLTISLKVYTIFILFYFLFKREFKPVLWTLVFLVVFNAISFLVFGFDQAVQYYQTWVSEVAPQSFIANHKNQSVFGAFLRFFTSEDPDHNRYVNILDVNPHTIKRITYLVIIAVSLIPAFLFRNKLKDKSKLKAVLEYSVVFTAIPILSPIAWKAYFIFLLVPYVVLYALLFRGQIQLKSTTRNLLRFLFWLSVILNVFSTELIVGGYISDWMEAYSAITFGTVILLFLQLYAVVKVKDFDLDTVVFKTLPTER